MVTALVKDPKQILGELTPGDCNLIHMAVGIAGEAGELLDQVKKATIYRKPLDRENVVEELGDLEFYMEGLRQQVGGHPGRDVGGEHRQVGQAIRRFALFQ